MLRTPQATPTATRFRLSIMPHTPPSQGQGHNEERKHKPGPAEVSDIRERRAPAPARPNSSHTDLEQAIATLRARIDEEFRISERFDSKSRQLFALAGGFFAAVQAVTFSSIGSDGLSSQGKAILLGAALTAAAALVILNQRLADSEEPLEEEDVPPDDIVTWVETGQSEEATLLRLIGGLATIARSRVDNNKLRKLRHDHLQTVMRWSLIASGAQLLVAIAFHF